MEQSNSQDAQSIFYNLWAQKYSILNADEKKDPMRSLVDQCTALDFLFYLQEDFWKVIALILHSHNLGGRDKSSMDWDAIFQNIHKLWELSNLIKILVRDEKLTYFYNWPDI